MKKLQIWIKELRLPFFTATLLPVTLGAAIAWNITRYFSLFYFILTIVSMFFIHMGLNVVNDYFDHVTGNDDLNVEFVRPFTGGSRIIQEGLLSPREVFWGAISFFLIGSSVGLYLAYVRGWLLLPIGFVGVFTGYFYCEPNVGLVRRGLGEILTGLNCGLLIPLGSYFVQTQQLAWQPIAASLPLAFLISAVLIINEFPDYDADKAVGKNNLVVRLGKEKGIIVFEIVITSSYMSATLTSLLGLTPPWVLLFLLSLPLFLRARATARKNFDMPKKLAPANAMTVFLHLCAVLVLILAYLLDGIQRVAMG